MLMVEKVGDIDSISVVDIDYKWIMRKFVLWKQLIGIMEDENDNEKNL